MDPVLAAGEASIAARGPRGANLGLKSGDLVRWRAVADPVLAAGDASVTPEVQAADLSSPLARTNHQVLGRGQGEDSLPLREGGFRPTLEVIRVAQDAGVSLDGRPNL